MGLDFFTNPEQEHRVRPANPPISMDLEDLQNLKAAKKRFLAINQERLNRTQESLRMRQREFLPILPLLFHINHRLLPGYVSQSTPCIVSQYQPSSQAMEAARQFSKTFGFNKHLLPTKASIYGLFVIGSAGTVAHSEKSDLDIWLCHDPALSKADLQELSKKAVRIEEWANTFDLETHFFLMNADTFRSGETVDLSSESSGTAQHQLLLEEFYRTSLLVAGRVPAWWLIPPNQERNYETYLKTLVEKRLISEEDFLDFGSIGHIPAEEFFGAALWQVYKGVDSPYKSVLKILLMETYAEEYPNLDLLCARYKKALYSGVVNLDLLDPYIILIEKLEDYLAKQNNPARVELVRLCFYFKIGLLLSTVPENERSHWRSALMEALVNRWGWDEKYISFLDSRKNWKMVQVVKARQSLVKELSDSYLFLSNFARENASLLQISQHDLNILGRKLYAAFERKPGKMEMINHGMGSNLFETHLTLEQVVMQDGKEGWKFINPSQASKPEETLDAEESGALKYGLSVISLLTWFHFNQVINPRTVVTVHLRPTSSDSVGQPRVHVLSSKEVHAITQTLQDFVPGGKFKHLEIETLKQPPHIMKAIVFSDVGMDPLAYYGRTGSEIISGRNDALRYSSFSINLVCSVDLIVITSWHEVYCFSYTESTAILDSLVQYLRWNLENKLPDPPIPKAYSFSSSYGSSIMRRVAELYQDVVPFFTSGAPKSSLRYVLACGADHYVLYVENNALQYAKKESILELQKALAAPASDFMRVQIDRRALTDTVLPTIYKVNQKNAVQLFYQVTGNMVNIYVLDEHGSLFFQRTTFYDENILMGHFEDFFTAVLKRRATYLRDSNLPSQSIDIHFYQIFREANTFTLRPASRKKQQKRYFDIQALSDVGGNIGNFVIRCEGHEFSSYVHGNFLFKEVANHVFELRRSTARYPIYITDIDLTTAFLQGRPLETAQVADFLNYKKRIEDKLNLELGQTETIV
ncbi:adenylate cyclase, class 1 [Gammaproteobacteria bacterium]